MTDKQILRLCAIRCHDNSLSRTRYISGSVSCDEQIRIYQDISCYVSLGSKPNTFALTDLEVEKYLSLKKANASDFNELRK